MKRFLLYCLLFLLFVAGCSQNNSSSDAYSVEKRVYLENKGSDTIVNLALAWAEAYQKVRPEVSISVTGGGTGTGIASLINNTVDLANASRQIKQEEIEAANLNGVNPVEFVVARDAIAIVVNILKSGRRINHPANFRYLQWQNQQLDGGWW